MRRIRRVASIILLTLGLLLGVVWVASAWYEFTIMRPGLLLGIWSGKAILLGHYWRSDLWRMDGLWDLSVDQHDHQYFHLFRFDYRHDFTGLEVSFPLWLPAVMLTAVGIWGCLATRHRFPTGACQACGYDLQGTTSDRCSECGAATEAA